MSQPEIYKILKANEGVWFNSADLSLRTNINQNTVSRNMNRLKTMDNIQEKLISLVFTSKGKHNGIKKIIHIRYQGSK